jgi:hypothetical protein
MRSRLMKGIQDAMVKKVAKEDSGWIEENGDWKSGCASDANSQYIELYTVYIQI